MFAPIFEDILTLKLINGFHITHITIVIVKLTDIWGRQKEFVEPIVQVVEHNHSYEDVDSMWTGCFTARKALAEVYGIVPMYITHSPISPIGPDNTRSLLQGRNKRF